MNQGWWLCVLALGLELVVGCEPAPRRSPQQPSRDPAAELVALDHRSPVPLLPAMALHQKQSMRDHLVAVQEIVQGLADNDLVAVERAASRIGFSETMGRMCTHMGAGAPGFTEQAVAFHHTADRVADAAREGDSVAALSALGDTLRSCTSCHATWKQEVVTDEAFERIAANQSPPAGHKHD